MCTRSLSSTRALLRHTWLFYECLAHTGTERLSRLIQQAEPSKVPLGTSATTSTIKIREVTIFFSAFGWTPLPSNPWCRIHIPHPPCRNHRFCLCFQLHKKFSLNLYFCIFFGVSKNSCLGSLFSCIYFFAQISHLNPVLDYTKTLTFRRDCSLMDTKVGKGITVSVVHPATRAGFQTSLAGWCEQRMNSRLHHWEFCHATTCKASGDDDESDGAW